MDEQGRVRQWLQRAKASLDQASGDEEVEA
jgi:hypothetical protein